jgi:hypothetical protein
LPELFKTRIFAIACGYEDANDLDRLRHDPLLKLAVGRCPRSGAPLCSQSTMSRLENMPTKIEAARLTAALVDQFCISFARAPTTLTLDPRLREDKHRRHRRRGAWRPAAVVLECPP